MCDFGISEAIMATLVGTAADAAAGTAATAGLFGAGGSFALAQAVPTAIGLGGSLLSGVGSIVQGQQQKQMAETNADLMRKQAVDAERRGSIAEGQQRTRYQQFIGKQRALMGSSGIVADEASFGDILAQSADLGERDAQQLRVNAGREAFGYRSQAKLDSYQGDALATAGMVKGGTSLLSGTWDFMQKSPWWQSWVNKTPDFGAMTRNMDTFYGPGGM